MAFTLMKNIKKKIDYNKPGAEKGKIRILLHYRAKTLLKLTASGSLGFIRRFVRRSLKSEDGSRK